MKKLIFILIAFTSLTNAQTIPVYSTIKLSKPTNVTTPSAVATIAADGTLNKTLVSDLLNGATVNDATSTIKGKIQLAGDLGGTATAPTVPGLATKENTITTGTALQYWRGDKSWQPLNKAAVGLGNVDNTSDLNKPISTATQTALNLKANDNEVVKKTGNQAVDGYKEFSSDITVNGLIIGRGHNNVAGNSVFGYNALMNNTTGSANLAIGFSSMYFNTSGSSNIAIGPSTLFHNTDGTANIAIGSSSLAANTAGSLNVAVGESALGNNQSGTGNIAIGQASGTDSVANITNQNSQIVMGNGSHTNAYIKIGWTVTSDARDKTNFASVPYGLSFVNSLQPIKYQFKKSRTDSTPVGDVKYGFKAQDILALEGSNPVIIDAKDPNNLKYTESNMIPVLVKAIQELSAQVEILKAK